jgi:hypothetical protein
MSFRDNGGIDGPSVTFYGTWGNVGQTFQGGAMKTDIGTYVMFPINTWCKITMSMLVGTEFNNKFDLNVEEVVGTNPLTYSSTGVDIVPHPYVTPNKISGSLANGYFVLASINNPQDTLANIFIDNLTLPGVVATSIDKTELNSTELYLFLNPTRGQLIVRSTIRNNKIATLYIYDISGKIVLQDTNFKGIKTYNLNDLSDGIYIVKLYSVYGCSVKKFILAK